MYEVEKFIADLERRNPSQPEFIQAVREVVESVVDVANATPAYGRGKILERITEPDRVISFRVEWEDDQGELHVNRGYRVQFSSVLGPYKGGLRFHANVTEGGLKFLGFEQTLKNSLTTMPIGGGKGGSDFSPKGRSESEIRRFCRAFMSELQKHIGPDLDVPAGDVGVGGREIGYLYGQLKQLRPQNPGVLTGKGLNWGGSLLRPEATGFGAVYFAQAMLEEAGDRLEGKRVAVSGFGNVAWGVAMKATQLGARVVTLSGPDGYILDESGIATADKWDYMLKLRSTNGDVIAPYAHEFGVDVFPGRKPWEVPVDIAFPCAIQNELDENDARMLVENRCKYLVETSNMGCTAEAVHTVQKAGLAFAPGKAANAGGVAVSALEMAQNSMRLRWTLDEVDANLRLIMQRIHASCLAHGRRSDGHIDYLKGANVAGFLRVADAMLDLGY